jgi:hypothetical protein
MLNTWSDRGWSRTKTGMRSGVFLRTRWMMITRFEVEAARALGPGLMVEPGGRYRGNEPEGGRRTAKAKR